DLIVIDGGKGQLSSAKRILDELEADIPLISLAKAEEEVFVSGVPFPLAFGKRPKLTCIFRRYETKPTGLQSPTTDCFGKNG
ncbi:MAG TPA: hypothetical protein VJ857_04855, partial [Methanocorpusculum sp.]|nr:hypothetical protein [Methanocorpusculum sp.]